MILIKSPIRVIITRIEESMGSILLCSARKANLLLYQNSRVLIYQSLIMGQIGAQAVDINIQAQEMEKTLKELTSAAHHEMIMPSLIDVLSAIIVATIFGIDVRWFVINRICSCTIYVKFWSLMG